MWRKLALSVIIISLLVSAGSTTAVDLTVPAGTTVTKNTAEEFAALNFPPNNKLSIINNQLEGHFDRSRGIY